MIKRSSIQRITSSVGNPIKTGRRSELFQDFCRRHGLSLKDPDFKIEQPNFIEKLKMKLALLNEYNEQTKILLDFYKSTGARGLTMLDELVNLKSQILEREEKIKQSGEDPLADKVLQSAKTREFAIIQFLERLKFDKDRVEAERKSKSGNSEDIAFVVEV